MKKWIRKYRKRIMVVLLLLGVSLIGFGLYLVLDYEKEMNTGYERLEIEKDLADDYIDYLLALKEQMIAQSQAATEGVVIPDIPSETLPEGDTSETVPVQPDEPIVTPTEPMTQAETPPKEPDWEDNLWLYSPEYAKGTIECVLEVPCAKIRRGVYTGAIENDLNYWMVVAARDEYVLGQTHYTIYGHNSTKHDLSFNNLQPNCKLGDTFTLTNIDGVYEYTITNLFSVSRHNATKLYVDNFKLPSNLCYIITCGRNEHRYKDFIVEGTLTKFTPLEELIRK